MINEGEPQDQIREREQLVSELKKLAESATLNEITTSQLQNILPKLFTYDEEIRLIVSSARLDQSRIAWDNKPNNTWSSVITEASHQPDGIVALIRSAHEYSQEVKLINESKLEYLLRLLNEKRGVKPNLVNIFSQLADLIRLGEVNLSDEETSRILDALRAIDFRQ